MLRTHEIRLVTSEHTYTRIILDSSSIRALRVGLSKMPDDINGPFKITCTPLCALEPLHQQEAA